MLDYRLVFLDNGNPQNIPMILIVKGVYYYLFKPSHLKPET